MSTPTEPSTPRYETLLEAARSTWWQSTNFDKWKSHYISEYPRGYFIRDQLARYAPEFVVEGARVVDVGCGDAGVLVAFAEMGAEAFVNGQNHRGCADRYLAVGWLSYSIP